VIGSVVRPWKSVCVADVDLDAHVDVVIVAHAEANVGQQSGAAILGGLEDARQPPTRDSSSRASTAANGAARSTEYRTNTRHSIGTTRPRPQG
jgi:hypothetical protein